MHDASVTAAAAAARQGSAAALAAALIDSRRDTLATFETYRQALPGLQVPQRTELNPPLWELGHIGWFQAWWLQRFAGRRQGHRADPDAPRRPAARPDADALYNSSLVPHARRWSLPLPDAEATCAELADQLQTTLALLAEVDDRGPQRHDPLYFFRLALLHEDMHHEAALYMAQGLGVAIADARWQAAALSEPPTPLTLEAGQWRLGSEADAGFAFDNELGAHPVAVPATRLDAQVVRWAEYLPFVEAGGYTDAQWWSEAGCRWLAQTLPRAPRYLRSDGSGWQQWRHGQWQALNPQRPACHLTYHEAEAWCRWAGRRLPAEAEWERAAIDHPASFRWGDVWEWTASPFAPYPGFTPHPYRDYSAPWFDGRPVLRGASFMTQPRLRHPRYRNYFPAQRNDVPAGFRSCAL
ncbi:MAG: selenoneine synthase SenA [Aquabacterium sp.]|nr:selenoneine synthase SenA [Aquabacterium sp.]